MIQHTVFLWQAGTHEENGLLLAFFPPPQLVSEFQTIHPGEMIVKQKQRGLDRLQDEESHLTTRSKNPLTGCLALEHF